MSYGGIGKFRSLEFREIKRRVRREVSQLAAEFPSIWVRKVGEREVGKADALNYLQILEDCHAERSWIPF